MSVKRIKIRTKTKKAVANRWLATGQTNILPVVPLQIPQGSLSEVAEAFESATGRRVILEHDQLLDIGSQGISRSLTVNAALRQMLMDPGVSYRLDGNNMYHLRMWAEV